MGEENQQRGGGFRERARDSHATALEGNVPHAQVSPGSGPEDLQLAEFAHTYQQHFLPRKLRVGRRQCAS